MALESVTVKLPFLSPHASETLATVPAPITAQPSHTPCPPVALGAVTVKLPLFSPHASATLATVPASITSQSPVRRRRRQRGKGSQAR